MHSCTPDVLLLQFKELLAAIFKYDWSGGPVVMETFIGAVLDDHHTL